MNKRRRNDLFAAKQIEYKNKRQKVEEKRLWLEQRLYNQVVFSIGKGASS